MSVDISDFCDAFLQPVPHAPVTARSDAVKAYVAEADRLDEANNRIVNGRDCNRDQRAMYQRGHVGK